MAQVSPLRQRMIEDMKLRNLADPEACGVAGRQRGAIAAAPARKK